MLAIFIINLFASVFNIGLNVWLIVVHIQNKHTLRRIRNSAL